jgi:hypothetical protein
MEVSVQLRGPAALPQGKSPWYPLDRRLGGPQSRSGRGGEEKNSQPPPEIELYNPDNPARSDVEINVWVRFCAKPVTGPKFWPQLRHVLIAMRQSQ